MSYVIIMFFAYTSYKFHKELLQGESKINKLAEENYRLELQVKDLTEELEILTN